MTINCYVTLNGQKLYPELPIIRRRAIVADDVRMLNGQMRRAYRAIKFSASLALSGASEAERTAWLAAAAVSASVAYTDELGVSRTVIVMGVSDDLVTTAPATPGGLSTTGAGTYDLRIDLEEV